MMNISLLRQALVVVGFVLTGVVAAQAGNRETIMAECAKQLQLSDSGCTCIVDRAENELSPVQQELLIAGVTDNQAGRMAAIGKMSPTEMQEVAAFMQSAPQTCSAQ
jgi:hypothetical protein